MKITEVKEVYNVKNSNNQIMNGENGSRLGMSQMLNVLCGWSSYDGYQVTTEKDTYLILIDNGQSCCENWGYMSSEDDLSDFVGAELHEVIVSDTQARGRNIEKAEEEYVDENEIQFVDFITSNGVLQLAVYNSHNGYYGHGIMVVKNNEILLQSTL